MKRRNFLKSIIGAASVVAAPSLALANKQQLYSFSDSSIEAYDASGAFKRDKDIQPALWIYRGWDVRLNKINFSEDEFGKLPFHRYIATKASQQINLEVDRGLLSLAEDKIQFVNNELDPFIAQANIAWIGG